MGNKDIIKMRGLGNKDLINISDFKIDIIGEVRGWEISPTSGTIDAEDSEPLVITFTCDPYMNESEEFNFEAHIINITANNHIDLKLVGFLILVFRSRQWLKRLRRRILVHRSNDCS